GLSQLRSAKNPNLPRPTHPVLSTPWLAAEEASDDTAMLFFDNQQATKKSAPATVIARECS
ncbi:hypothetical protein, partial [Piscirickettsia salmonis]|uniref:hypothetical protein n=1 Tax=Piscirickettsia salmonis TaxID=1238 RepID=UPI001C54ED1F